LFPRYFEEYIENNSEKFIEDLRELVKQPSVSAKDFGVKECAEVLRNLMERSGIQVSVIPLKGGNPVVYGELASKKGNKTLLVYGHYDTQPTDPDEEWVYPPFSAELRNGKIFGRGASDNKGCIVAILKAIETYLKLTGDVPVNLKLLFEGEEEIESPHLQSFISEYKGRLKSDAALCWDGGIHPLGCPIMSLGLKGMLYVELRCKIARSDLHSSRAPIVDNPAWRLIEALHSLRSRDGRILVDGWYRDLQPPTQDDLRLLDKIPFEEDQLLKEFGINEFFRGLHGKNALKALIYEPTCTICGIWSGYSGPRLKTVLPSKASAKIDFRLPYKLNPDTLLEKLKSHLKDKGFNDIEVHKIGASRPSKTSSEASIVKAITKASENVYGKKPIIYPCSPGSAPGYLFTEDLMLDAVWTGCAPPFCNAHAPNEFMTVENLIKGVKYAISILEEFRNVS